MQVTKETSRMVSVYQALPPIFRLPGNEATIMWCPTDSITFEVYNVQLQKGVTDCGLYAIVYATDLCHGNKPSNLHYN